MGDHAQKLKRKEKKIEEHGPKYYCLPKYNQSITVAEIFRNLPIFEYSSFPLYSSSPNSSTQKVGDL